MENSWEDKGTNKNSITEKALIIIIIHATYLNSAIIQISDLESKIDNRGPVEKAT